jgi:hypothetical protein
MWVVRAIPIPTMTRHILVFCYCSQLFFLSSNTFQMIHCYLIDFIYCVKLRHWKLDWLKYHKCHKKYNRRRNPLYRINNYLLLNKPFLKPSITWTNAYYPNKQIKTTWSFTLIVSFSNISIRFTNVVFSRRI